MKSLDSMTYTIDLSDNALADVDGHIEYIHDTLMNPTAARRFRIDIDRATVSLSYMPHRCPLVTAKVLEDLNLRNLIMRNHYIFFNINENDMVISVIRVLHVKQDWIGTLLTHKKTMPDMLHEIGEEYFADVKSDMVTKTSANLRNNYNQISKLCHEENVHIKITKDGNTDLVAMSVDEFDRFSGTTNERIQQIEDKLKSDE